MVNEILGDYFKKTFRTIHKKPTHQAIIRDIYSAKLPLTFDPTQPNQIFDTYFSAIKAGKYFRYVLDEIEDPDEKNFASAQLAWMLEGVTTGAAFVDLA